MIGIDITGELYALEGTFVVQLQSVIPDELSGYFLFVYLIGFTFMLVFPIVAYFVRPSQRYLEELSIASTINYGDGAACYISSSRTVRER